MNDMRRTILWVVFSVSLVLLWDAWNIHNGKPPMFAPRPVAVAASGALPGASAAVGTAAVPAAVPGTATAGAALPPSVPAAAAGAAAPLLAEKVTITTDVLKATLDSRGGDLVRLELLKYSDAADPLQHVVLFDQSAQRVYLAQTGLVTTQPGISLPNHLTLMQVLPGERTLTDGAKSLTLVFESPDVGGTRLVKTYTFNRGEYTVGVKHEFRNGSAAPISPQLYLQLTRDGNAPAGESSFYSTFTGPAMYTEASKFKKIEFKEIEKGGVDHDKSADSGWVGIVQHYFATA